MRDNIHPRTEVTILVTPYPETETEPIDAIHLTKETTIFATLYPKTDIQLRDDIHLTTGATIESHSSRNRDSNER